MYVVRIRLMLKFCKCIVYKIGNDRVMFYWLEMLGIYNKIIYEIINILVIWFIYYVKMGIILGI